jgi:hypothetical protein
MVMESPKATYEDRKMVIEGEFDIEIELSGMHPAFPPEDEDLFNSCAFEIKSHGEIKLDDVPDMVRWINTKTACKDPEKWPKWKITLERL